MVEIGDGFRLPDLIGSHRRPAARGGHHQPHQAGRLRSAIGPDTGCVLKVHPSNFRVEGFTSGGRGRRTRRAGRAGGRGHRQRVCSRRIRCCPTSRMPTTALRAGAALVTCSGDKLLGGPQAGLLLGTRRPRRPAAPAPAGPRAAGGQADPGRAARPPSPARPPPTVRRCAPIRAVLRDRCAKLAASLAGVVPVEVVPCGRDGRWRRRPGLELPGGRSRCPSARRAAAGRDGRRWWAGWSAAAACSTCGACRKRTTCDWPRRHAPRPERRPRGAPTVRHRPRCAPTPRGRPRCVPAVRHRPRCAPATRHPSGEHARRRDGRARRSRQVHAGACADRYGARPVGRGTPARDDHRPRLRVDDDPTSGPSWPSWMFRGISASSATCSPVSARRRRCCSSSPQTRDGRASPQEHLAAVHALRLSAGVLAVTRSDLADPAPALADARARIARTSLGGVARSLCPVRRTPGSTSSGTRSTR